MQLQHVQEGGSTDNHTIPTHLHPRNKFGRHEILSCYPGNTNYLATSLYGRHQDFGCYMGNKLVASHVRIRLKQVRVSQEWGQKQYLRCDHCSGKSTEEPALPLSGAGNAGTQCPPPVPSLKLPQPPTTTTFASPSPPIHALPCCPPPLRLRPVGILYVLDALSAQGGVTRGSGRCDMHRGWLFSTLGS